MDKKLWTVSFATLLTPVHKFLRNAINSDFDILSLLRKEKETISKFFDTALLVSLLSGSDGDQDVQSFHDLPVRAEDAIGFHDRGVDQSSQSGIVTLDHIVSLLNIGRGDVRRIPVAINPLENEVIFCGGDQPDCSVSEMFSFFKRDMVASIRFSKDINMLFSSTLRILERYTWCFPAQRDHSDVSLFDAAQITSAIAACLYRYDTSQHGNKASNQFLLIAGDFSGIQSYIFSKTNQRQQGMAKKLRARSFVVVSMLSLTIRNLLSRCDLPPSCTLMDGGGNFYILAPNTEETKDVIANLTKEIDDRLIEVFHGDVAVHIEWTPLTLADFTSLEKKVDEVKGRLYQSKKRPFASTMHKSGKWEMPDIIASAQSGAQHGLCSGCGREFIINGEEGWRCEQEARIGARLPKLDTIGYIPNDHSLLSLGDWAITLSKGEQDTSALRGDDKRWGHLPLKRMANHVPLTKSNEVVTFEKIAEKARGAEWLGYLKADVDNLGTLFSLGFADSEGHAVDQACKLTALSRMMEVFFTECVDRILEECFQDCYTVFSGGDDLFVIGPWDQIIQFALVLHQKFTLFTGGNPNVTLSAGIALMHPGKPVAYGAEEAEAALDKAKRDILKHKNETESKDQLCIFGHVMKWKNLESTLSQAKSLVQWLNGKLVTKGDVQKLQEYAQMFESYCFSEDENKNVLGLRYAGLLAYDIARKRDERARWGSENEKKALNDYYRSLMCVDCESPMYHLRVVTEYALLVTRGRKNGL